MINLKLQPNLPGANDFQDSAPASAGATRTAVPAGIILCMGPVDERDDVTT